MSKLDYQVICLSHLRADRIAGWTMKLFPDCLVCIEESELQDYLPYVPKSQLLLHPKYKASASIRNFIIDYCKAETVIVPDDDLLGFSSFVGNKVQKYTEPDEVLQIVENAIFVANHIGARHFGWNQTPTPWSLTPQDPITFHKWVGTIVGITGKNLKYDDLLLLRADIDYCLTQLKVNRIIMRDDRFYMDSAPRYKEPGGNNIYRSDKQIDGETRYIQDKWGKYVHFSIGMGTTTKAMVPVIKVPRQQNK